MASMNGLEVKGVKFFPDHEGAMIPYGNIYLNNKKVGSFRTDSWGGPMMYDHTHKTITQKEVSEALHGIITKLGWDEFYDSMDILIDELVALKEYESHFKKAQKKQKFLMVVKDDYYVKPDFTNHTFPTVYEVADRATQEDVDRVTKQLSEKHGKDKVVCVYRSLDDFIL